MADIDMTAYGLTGQLAALASAEAAAVGRVLAQDRGSYRVVSASGERTAEVSGRFLYGAEDVGDYPVVGDFVWLREEEGFAMIRGILPRRSAFVRRAAGALCVRQVVAANIDTAFICMALNSDFNLRRLERYLAVTWDSGAVPVVVLTKADLCENMAQRLSEVACVAAGAEVVTVSAMETDGLHALEPYLRPGKTVALLGSSGVGKSTIINRLLGEERLQTGGLRDDGRGRHTTTRRELFLLEHGGMVIDTPGMRELGLWDVDGGLEQSFADIEALAASCRFGDCSHGSEPGCAVRAAVESGSLARERLQSYQKLCAESRYAADTESYLAEKKEKFKRIAKINRSARRK